MRLGGRLGVIIFRMVIDRDEFRPQTIPQFRQFRAFLASTLEVHFCVPDSADARYAHIGWPRETAPMAHSRGLARGICLAGHGLAAMPASSAWPISMPRACASASC